jgi:YD repeat-containing protein
MEPYPPAVRLATIATLCTLLAPGTSAVAPQQPPDPQIEVPQARGWIPADPCESGTELGALYRPKGRVRSVTWFQAVPEEARRSVKRDWEKRVVQRFDDEGLCVEVERWCCGARVSSRIARSPTGSVREFEQSWGHPLFENPWREENVCDRTGAKIGLVRIPLALVGREVSDPLPWIAARWEYDETGRCLRETRFDEALWPCSIRRWHYDDCGRIDRVVDHAGSSQESREYEYDEEGRTTAMTSRGPGDRAVRRSRFDYDVLGRLSRTAEQVDGTVTRSVVFGYGEDGRLVRRETQSFSLDGPGSLDVETFEGIDRPLTREVRGPRGQVLARGRWSYEDDERGNWIVKRCPGITDGPDAMRAIEYAD